MTFVKPIPFQDAIAKLGSQSPVGSTFSSSEWSDVPVELRENAFFSSRVESAQFLQRAQEAINDFLSANRKPAANGEPMLATGSRAAFVSQMQDFLAREGVLRSTGGLTDIAGEKRLGLIFDVKTRQAQDFGFWKQGMNADVLNEFPAMRFIRVKDVKEPRFLHEQFQDKVFLKTDPVWAMEINHDFGVPWGPWGWGCGHDVEDVDRDEAEELGLLKAGDHLTVGPGMKKFLDLNHNLQASTKSLPPELVEKLLKEFGDRITYNRVRDTISWNSKRAEPVLGAPSPAPGQGTGPAAATHGQDARATTTPARQSPVSGAADVQVTGRLKDQVDLALAAIDRAHDDGKLTTVPIEETTRGNVRGFMKPVMDASGTLTTKLMAIKAGGPWPALTTVHEIGHWLDLAAIGAPGGFATVNLDGGMAAVLAAADQTDAIKELRKLLAATSNPDVADMCRYLLDPREIWARAYAQFIAGRGGTQVLKDQLAAAQAAHGEKWRQWSAADFVTMADAITTMLKGLGWL